MLALKCSTSSAFRHRTLRNPRRAGSKGFSGNLPDKYILGSMLEIRAKHYQKRPNYDQNGKKLSITTKNDQNMAKMGINE